MEVQQLQQILEESDYEEAVLDPVLGEGQVQTVVGTCVHTYARYAK